MNLNDQIDTTAKFTLPPEGIPQKDHSEQVSVAMEWARRLENRQAEAPMKPMPPIIPVAN